MNRPKDSKVTPTPPFQHPSQVSGECQYGSVSATCACFHSLFQHKSEAPQVEAGLRVRAQPGWCCVERAAGAHNRHHHPHPLRPLRRPAACIQMPASGRQPLTLCHLPELVLLPLGSRKGESRATVTEGDRGQSGPSRPSRDAQKQGICRRLGKPGRGWRTEDQRWGHAPEGCVRTSSYLACGGAFCSGPGAEWALPSPLGADPAVPSLRGQQGAGRRARS